MTRVFERNSLEEQSASAHAGTVECLQDCQACFECPRRCLTIPLIVSKLSNTQQGVGGRPTRRRAGERKSGFQPRTTLAIEPAEIPVEPKGTGQAHRQIGNVAFQGPVDRSGNVVEFSINPPKDRACSFDVSGSIGGFCE